MYSELLPVGSVVLLNGAEKRLMICGRVMASGENNEIYDYIGCHYPEGIVDSSEMYFFNHDQINGVFFLGYQNEEEFNLRENVLGQLDGHELEVVDGAITIKE